MINDILIFSILGVIGFIITFLITPRVGEFMKSKGKVGKDVHKVDSPEIPESGGIGFMFVYLILIIVGIFLTDNSIIRSRFMIFGLIIFLVILLGLYDDFKGLSALAKPLLLVLISLPIILFRNFGGNLIANPNPILPFVGETRLSIVYWGLAVFVIAIPSNASNMLDVMNGVMSLSGILIATTAFLSTFIIPLPNDAIYVARYASLTLIGVLLAFWLFNRYPAKIFAGDTGSLGVGAAIGLIAIYGHIEFVLVIALLVHIMNSFSILSSIGGLKERHQIKERPVYVKDGIVYPSTNPKAPITMVRLLVARNPLPENKIIKKIIILVVYSCILALITAFLMRLEVVR